MRIRVLLYALAFGLTVALVAGGLIASTSAKSVPVTIRGNIDRIDHGGVNFNYIQMRMVDDPRTFIVRRGRANGYEDARFARDGDPVELVFATAGDSPAVDKFTSLRK